MTYDPKSHKAADCRNDHPVPVKLPFGFRGFHLEDYGLTEEDLEDEE